MYSIMNTFGDFNIEGFEGVSLIIFVIASLVNLVILLNLVIAIISEVFNTVHSQRLESFYMQRA